MQISVLDKKAGELKADVFIVPVAEGEEKKGAVRELSTAMRAAVEARVDKTKFKGRSGRTLTVQTDDADVVLAGTGKDKSAEALRSAAARGIAAAQAVRAKHVVIAAGAAAASDVTPLLEGALLAGYSFDRYKSRKKDKDDEPYKGPSRLTVAGTEVSHGLGRQQAGRSSASDLRGRLLCARPHQRDADREVAELSRARSAQDHARHRHPLRRLARRQAREREDERHSRRVGRQRRAGRVHPHGLSAARQGQSQDRGGRQGHHLRFGRALAQARQVDGVDEAGHVGRRGGSRPR